MSEGVKVVLLAGWITAAMLVMHFTPRAGNGLDFKAGYLTSLLAVIVSLGVLALAVGWALA